MNETRRVQLERYFDGELPPSEIAEIESQLAGDPEGRTHLTAVEKLRSLANAEVVSRQAFSVKEISAAIDREPVRAMPAKSILNLRFVAGTCGAALAAGVLIMVVLRSSNNSGKETLPDQVVSSRAPAQSSVERTRRNDRRQVQLHQLTNGKMADAVASAEAWSVITKAGPRTAAKEVALLELANHHERTSTPAELSKLMGSKKGKSRGRSPAHPTSRSRM